MIIDFNYPTLNSLLLPSPLPFGTISTDRKMGLLFITFHHFIQAPAPYKDPNRESNLPDGPYIYASKRRKAAQYLNLTTAEQRRNKIYPYIAHGTYISIRQCGLWRASPQNKAPKNTRPYRAHERVAKPHNTTSQSVLPPRALSRPFRFAQRPTGVPEHPRTTLIPFPNQ
jgi:hypothetical protein